LVLSIHTASAIPNDFERLR